MYRKNKVKQMLHAGEIPLSMRCCTGDPTLMEVMALTGFAPVTHRLPTRLMSVKL